MGCYRFSIAERVDKLVSTYQNLEKRLYICLPSKK
jgi:hypothetical protein